MKTSPLSLALGAALLASSALPGALRAADEPIRVKLSLEPAAPPVRELQYELLPPIAKQRPGNAALAYYNIILANRESNLKQVVEDAAKALKDDRSEDTLASVEKQLADFQRALNDLPRAASYRDCDWQPHLEDGYAADALLPAKYRQTLSTTRSCSPTVRPGKIGRLNTSSAVRSVTGRLPAGYCSSAKHSWRCRGMG